MMEQQFHQIAVGEKTFQVEIPLGSISFDKKEIAFALGYTTGILPQHFDEMVESILSQLPEYCAIEAGYKLLDVKKADDRNDGLFVGNKFFKLQKIVTGQLRKSEHAAFFVCTIGQAMEIWAKKLAVEGDAPLSYLVDTVASVVAEETTDLLHDHIGNQMQAQGLKITNRYSPGYCDWSVSEQHLLFSFLPANFCGITLTESALMVPIKSVSGIIGIGTAVKRVDYTCNSCGMKDCTYRAIRDAKAAHDKGVPRH